MTDMLVLFIWGILGFTTAALGGRFLQKSFIERAAALSALAINGSCLFLLVNASGRWPVFNLSESFLIVSFALGVLGTFSPTPRASLPDAGVWVYLEMLLLLVIALVSVRTPEPFRYDHDYVFNVLFHLFRLLSLSLMLFASALFIQARIENRRGRVSRGWAHLARNFLILASVFFLMAEYVGILWCQNGWGDFWMWSEGFFPIHSHSGCSHAGLPCAGQSSSIRSLPHPDRQCGGLYHLIADDRQEPGLNTATQKLSSLRLTTWILIVLAGWLVWGIRLAGSVPFTPGFRSMNDQLVRSWPAGPGHRIPPAQVLVRRAVPGHGRTGHQPRILFMAPDAENPQTPPRWSPDVHAVRACPVRPGGFGSFLRFHVRIRT